MSTNPSNGRKVLDNLIILFFKHQLSIKVYHFQTKKYSSHKTCDEYLKKFRKNLDRFMEVAQGTYGKLETTNVSITFDTLNDDTILGAIGNFISLFDDIIKKHFTNNTDLTNIRDEILGDANQFRYLLTFN